jgi:hypothetical protein
MTPFWWLAVLDGGANVVVVVLPEFVAVRGTDGSYAKLPGTGDAIQPLSNPANEIIAVYGTSGSFCLLIGASDLFHAIRNDDEQRTLNAGEEYKAINGALNQQPLAGADCEVSQ